MDTRRCLRCHKLLRADAQRCSRCGYVFSQEPVRRITKAITQGSNHSTTATFPSNGPASPHRAGHYSGLHPEDQPYQSSFMPILRPAAITRRLDDQVPEDVLESVAASSAHLQETLGEERQQAPKRFVASPVPVPVQLPQRSPGVLARMDTPLPLSEVEPLFPVQDVTRHEHITAPLPVSPYAAASHRPRNRAAHIFFVAAILSFLLGSGILTYLVVFSGKAVPAHQVTNGAHSGNQQVLPSAPQLQLPASHIDFGAVKEQHTIALTNAGGQQVSWQAGVSNNSSWLSIAPSFGTFTQKETVTVTVNRSNLTPQTYTGYINFFQQRTNDPLTLAVTMSVTGVAATVTASPSPTIVNAGPSPLPAMAVSTSALSFNAIQGNNPAVQAFTLSNPGNAQLNWAITDNASPSTLLSLSPKSGTVAPGGSVPVSVAPNISAETSGIINATITIQDTDPGTSVKSQQVAVRITISNQALISVSTTNISCKLSSATTTVTQQLQITNAGSATLNWALSQSIPAWMSIDISSGTLPAGFIAFVNVACNNTALQVGTYTYTLVVSDTDAHTPVAPQNILVTLTVS